MVGVSAAGEVASPRQATPSWRSMPGKNLWAGILLEKCNYMKGNERADIGYWKIEIRKEQKQFEPFTISLFTALSQTPQQS
jgi:hypothetical protein